MLSVFYFSYIFLSFFFLFGADVGEFYEQCDPGEVSLLLCNLFNFLV